MCSVEGLREFINARLSAAAVEIFTVVQQTIIQYREEVDAKILDFNWREETNTHTTTELTQQPFFDGTINSTFDREQPQPPQNEEVQENPEVVPCEEVQEETEPPMIKEEPQDVYSSQDEEQLELKQDVDTFMVTVTDEYSKHFEPDVEHLFPHDPVFAERQDQKKGLHKDSELLKTAKLNLNRKEHSNNVDEYTMSESWQGTDQSRECLTCGICGKMFQFTSQVEIHYRSHTGEKPFPCETCGKSFGMRSTLLRHIRSHTGEKPYTCQTCGKSFSQNSSMLSHMRTHTGERPFHCNVCTKSFTHLSTLRKHMMIHSGEKPYSCMTCGKCFSQQSSLLAHMRSHTGEKPFGCNMCGKHYSQRSALSVHMKIHNDKILNSEKLSHLPELAS